jgi:hypothetical protein
MCSLFSTLRQIRPYGPYEGLTIFLEWPKGYFREPTAEQKFRSFAQDNRDALIAGGGLLVIFIYYIIVWVSVGRDPAPGIIMPLYEPPPGFSPSAMRYLVRMGYDDKAFTSAVLDMAVKGFLKIEEGAGMYTLSRTKADGRALTAEEKAEPGRLWPSCCTWQSRTRRLKHSCAILRCAGGSLERRRCTWHSAWPFAT